MNLILMHSDGWLCAYTAYYRMTYSKYFNTKLNFLTFMCRTVTNCTAETHRREEIFYFKLNIRSWRGFSAAFLFSGLTSVESHVG